MKWPQEFDGNHALAGEAVFKQALADMQPVREMTVEEVALAVYSACTLYTKDGAARDVALALAKLGTIRIKE